MRARITPLAAKPAWVLSLVENPQGGLRTPGGGAANYLRVGSAGADVVGCMLATPMPTLTAAPTTSEAIMIISHIFRVTFMVCASKSCQHRHSRPTLLLQFLQFLIRRLR